MTVPERHEGQNQVLVGGVFEVVLEMGVQLGFNSVKTFLNGVQVVRMDFPYPDAQGNHKGA